MLREDFFEVWKYAADKLEPGTEQKPLDRKQPEIQNKTLLFLFSPLT